MNIQIVIAMTYVYSGFAALCDFTVGLLPIFLVRKLHMKQKTKMAVVGILSMACMYVIPRVVEPDPETNPVPAPRPPPSFGSPGSIPLPIGTFSVRCPPPPLQSQPPLTI